MAKITVDDVMLDLATGDASYHDAYIQESVGQVNVAGAYGRAGLEIAALDDADRQDIVQEAADAGIPSDMEGAIELVYESVEQQLNSTYKHIFLEAAKDEACRTKATSPQKLFYAMCKATNCNVKPSATPEFAKAIASSITKNKEIAMKANDKFWAASYAKKCTRDMINGIGILANAYGIDTDNMFDAPTIKFVIGAGLKASIPDEITVSYISSAIKSAKKHLDSVTGDLKAEYVSNASATDIATTITCYFAMGELCSFVKKTFSANASKASTICKKACSKAKANGGVDGDVSSLCNELVGLNKTVLDSFTKLMDAFNSSISSLTSAL